MAFPYSLSLHQLNTYDDEGLVWGGELPESQLGEHCLSYGKPQLNHNVKKKYTF